MIKNKPVLPPKTEFKSFHFERKSIDEDQGIITGYLSTFGNVDLQDDRVIKGAFSKTVIEGKARMQKRGFIWPCLWMHDPDQPIGKVVDAEEDETGLLITVQLDITMTGNEFNNPKAATVFSGFKQSYISEMSMGYLAIQKDYDKGVRNLKECAIVEASAVTGLFAANPEAQVTGVKMGIENTEKPVQRKDFNDLFIAAQAADCLEDWCDLTNTITQTMLQIFGMGDSPQSDMADCLEQFSAAVNKWLGDAVACNLGQYINDQGYCSPSTPYVPYSLRTGSDYGYMARANPLQGSKVGATISAATQSTLQAHQEGMKAHLDTMQTEMKGMQQKVSDLTQLWKDTDQGEPYDNDKSRTTRREPPQTLTHGDVQPLHKSTVNDDVVAELEALFT